MNKEIENSSIILKVGGITNPGSLKTAIIGHLRDGKTVHAVSVGVAAVYVTTKAIILVRGHMEMINRKLNYDCYYEDVLIDDPTSPNEKRQKTAIRWTMTME